MDKFGKYEGVEAILLGNTASLQKLFSNIKGERKRCINEKTY